jgi:hypothetical protein
VEADVKGNNRRDPQDTANAHLRGGITASQADKGRSRDWEDRQRQDKEWRVVTFRHVPAWVHERINEIAKAKGVSRDEVARKMLEFALWEHQKGRLPLEPVLRGKLTLFPEEKG